MAVDAGAALTVAVVFWLPGLIGESLAGWAWAGSTLAALAAVAMLLRWRWPAAATTVATAATLGGTALGVTTDPMLASAWCLYPLALAHTGESRRVAIGVGFGLTMIAAVTAVPARFAHWERLVLGAAALGASWLVASTEARRIKLVRDAAIAEVAARESQTQLAVAREVHDVVGHALALIGAEAGVSRALSDATNLELRQSLAEIERHARSAVTEVQALVRSLRGVPSPQTQAQSAQRPSGSMAHIAPLAEVIAATRAAGVSVMARLDITELAPVVTTTAARIVQEALSNVVRHAPGASCEVEAHVDAGALVIRVCDDGPGLPAGATKGCGLRGMRERAASVGGTLVCRNRDGGGFVVEARLPLDGMR